MKGKSNTLAENRKARHDYFIEETYEAGIELYGTEVKSVKLGKANLKDSYAYIKNGEIFLSNLHISPYEKGNIFNKDPLRVRRLLLHKSEIRKLEQCTTQEGLTLVPLALYEVRGLVKVKIAVAKGKKLYDKRQDIAKKDAQRDIERSLREKY
ncbi:MAG: SsrA-binding protein SmpB [Clostridium sp.]|uniref:SsrA-binding protein SmpB n=1 Tax=Clostridium sp. TaxID=1506 RepID=UPI002FC8CBEA